MSTVKKNAKMMSDTYWAYVRGMVTTFKLTWLLWLTAILNLLIGDDSRLTVVLLLLGWIHSMLVSFTHK